MTLIKKLRWQLLILAVTLGVVGLLLSTRQAGLPQVYDQPTQGGVYTEALIGTLGRLNPLLDWDNQADRDVDRLIFSGLVRFDATGLPHPDLAASWGISIDGTIYNVSLRPEARWHDGEPVTSDDVLFTIELLKGPASRYPQDIKDLWNSVQVEKLDDHTLKFTLPEPFAPFLDYLTFGILPKHLLGDVPPAQLADAPFNIAPVGTGPYRFDHLLVENGQIQGVVLSAFEEYAGGMPYIEQVIFRYYPNAQAAWNAYQEGEVLGIGQVTTDILPGALQDETLALYTVRQPQISMVFFNHNSEDAPFLAEKDVRQALLLGLNRRWIVDRILNGQAIIANGPIFPGTWAYYEGLETVPYDPDQAIELLKKAGYTLLADSQTREKEGVALAFTMLYPDDALHAEIAENIRKDWERLGVTVTLKAVPYDQLIFENLAGRNYQAALVEINLSRSPDPDPYPFWHQSEATGGQNYTGWDNRAASEYLEQARINPDPAERRRLYRNFQVVFAKELPALPLYYPVYNYGISQQVQGVQVAPLFDPADRFDTISRWYLVTRRALQPTATAEQR